jgi:hypothetical protein
MSVAPVFTRSLASVRRSDAGNGTDLTPLESPSFTNRNRAESITPQMACLFYRLIKHGQQYVDQGTEYYQGSAHR